MSIISVELLKSVIQYQKMKKQILILPFIALLFVQCSHTYSRMRSSPQDVITESLFNDKDRTLSEDNIKTLLDGKLILPDTLRVAVFQVGMNNRFYSNMLYQRTNEVSVRGRQSLFDSLSLRLKQNPRVEEIHAIPTMMLSTYPNITQLREASVRLQSDVLLVYSTVSDIYTRYKVIKKDEVKAFATTELFLLDIRTGLIPFSTVVTKDVLAKETKGELSDETRKRAEQEATLMTLLEIGEQVKAFLSKNK
jgi:hypothetical protein